MKTVCLTAFMCVLFAFDVSAQWTNSTTVESFNGSVGIGTSTPGSGLASTQEAPLHILSTQNKNTLLLVQNLTNDSNVVAAFRTQADVASQSFHSHASIRTISRFGVTLGGWNEFLSVSGNGLVMGTLAGPLILGTNNANRLQIATNGNVGIGAAPSAVLLEVGGDAHFGGTVTGNMIVAQYQDVAEWVPALETMPAGTVVIVSQEGTNAVTPSKHAYDTSVAGVVSPNPGLLLGVASDSKAKIATTGRVRVRVDATKSPIRKGDLLVTSDKPGMAMLSEPLDLGGVKIHRPGTLIGKALEPLASGEGEILVLLSLQ